MSKRKIELDGDTADSITVTNLIEYRDYLKKELKQWKKNPKTDSNPDGYWMHPEDVANSAILIESMNNIIKWFGK
jgi:hypothetical protein